MRNRWTGLAAAMLIQGCGGLTYTYAVYSEHLKDALDYTQEDTDDVGAAKDFGYCIGIIGGLLYNHFAPWVTISVGASLHFLGYFMLWLAITERVEVPFWLVCTSIAVGVGGDSWMDTACMMTSLQNFKESRGTVVGLEKAQIGISGAMFVTIYKAFLQPDVDKFVLLVAFTPSIVGLLMAFFIVPSTHSEDDNANLRLQSAYGGIIVLAVFLLMTIVTQALLQVDKPVLMFFAFSMIIILVVTYTLMVSSRLLPFLAASLKGCGLAPHTGHLPYVKSEAVPTEESCDGTTPQSREYNVPKNHSRGDQSGLEDDTIPLKAQNAVSESFSIEDNTSLQEKGMPGDLTLWQSMQQLDYWLLALIMMTGPGSGLAVINNLAQMGKALLSKNVELYVGLISIWSCFGRLAAGYGSDAMVRAGYPRPLCIFLSQGALAGGCLLLSLGRVSLLYVGSAVVGFCYGSFWALTPAILSEVFGLRHFAAIYKTIVSCSPVGAFLLSAKVIGFLYDEEVERLHEQSLDPDFDDQHTCYGHQCFQFSLQFIALICVAGAAASVLLTFRTQRFYSQSS